jgi:hypothetical protein
MTMPEVHLVEGLSGLDLDKLDAPRAWAFLRQELFGAAATNRHPFHLLSLATTDEAGAPEIRTVVLRRFLGFEREVWFNTDFRSPKVSQLQRDARVALLWYDSQSRVQIRIPAKATLHHLDEKAKQAWDKSLPMSRACYCNLEGPGEILECGPGEATAGIPSITTVESRIPVRIEESKDEPGWCNFVTVCCQFDQLDLLLLKSAGHQRARFHFDTNPIRWDRLAP